MVGNEETPPKVSKGVGKPTTTLPGKKKKRGTKVAKVKAK